MRRKFQLYVWQGFCPDHTDGLAVAVARSEEEARETVRKAHGINIDRWGDLSIHPLNSPIAFAVSGGG